MTKVTLTYEEAFVAGGDGCLRRHLSGERLIETDGPTLQSEHGYLPSPAPGFVLEDRWLSYREIGRLPLDDGRMRLTERVAFASIEREIRNDAVPEVHPDHEVPRGRPLIEIL